MDKLTNPNGPPIVDEPVFGDRHLYSEAIYRLNSELQFIRESICNPSDINLVPTAFDRRRRGFRWLTVHDENWQWTEKLLRESKRALRSLFNNWDKNQKLLGEQWFEPLPRVNEKWVFGDLERYWRGILNTPESADGAFSLNQDDEYHRALLELVAGRVNPGSIYIEGLILQAIQEAAQHNKHKQLMWVTSELLSDEYDAENIGLKPAAFVCHYLADDPSPERYYSQTDGQIYESKDELAWQMSILFPKGYWPDRSWDLALQNAILQFDPNTDSKSAGKQLRRMVSVPIYDGGIPRDPWGRLVGIVHVMVYSDRSVEDCESIAQRVIDCADRLPTAFRTIARAQVAGAPVDEDRSATGLSVQHFLRLLPSLHDWEHVAVFNVRPDRTRDIVECWGRDFEKPSHGTAQWGQLKPPEACPICECLDRRVIELKKLNRLIRMRWASQSDLDQLAGLEFVFELPKYTLLPSDKGKREQLDRQYLHELIDIFRLVLPKVERHRYAIRTAAVAIMSRNMSHNIGSHVLTSVASEKLGERTAVNPLSMLQTLKNQLTERHNLFGYLQERMDFLAEIATTRSYMSIPASFKEILKEFKTQKLLVGYITAIDAKAEVQDASGVDYMMASPGGRHGGQALYVMFENIIRNSAKNRPPSPEGIAPTAVKLKARIQESEPASLGSETLLSVRIWDLAGNGRQQKFGSELHERINNVIRRDSIIDERGRLKDGNWGLRELTVAAAYLRRTEIEDIESYIPGPPLLRAIVVNDDGEDVDGGTEGNLCYEFFVERPRTVLLIESALPQGTALALQIGTLRRKGVEVVNSWKDDSHVNVEHKYLIGAREGFSPTNLPVRKLTVTDEEGIGACVGRSRLDEALAADGSDSASGKVWNVAASAWAHFIRCKYGLQGAELYHVPRAGESACGKNWNAAVGIENAVVYDHHTILGRQDGLAMIRRALFWEHYRDGFDQAALFEKPDPANREALAAEFVVAGIARIIVLDERVQDEIGSQQPLSEGGNTLSMADAVKLRRIYVPTVDDCDLRQSPNREKIENFLTRVSGRGPSPGSNGSVRPEPVDFIVIHQGILDRLGEDDDISWMRSEASKVGAELVICSGRGAPPQVARAGVRFVPLSSILRWVVQRPSKYHLYELLSASRKVSHV